MFLSSLFHSQPYSTRLRIFSHITITTTITIINIITFVLSTSTPSSSPSLGLPYPLPLSFYLPPSSRSAAHSLAYSLNRSHPGSFSLSLSLSLTRSAQTRNPHLTLIGITCPLQSASPSSLSSTDPLIRSKKPFGCRRGPCLPSASLMSGSSFDYDTLQ